MDTIPNQSLFALGQYQVYSGLHMQLMTHRAGFHSQGVTLSVNLNNGGRKFE